MEKDKYQLSMDAPLYQPLRGYLRKLGEKGLVRTWKKRWFSLSDNVLSYFKDDQSKECLGQIELAKAVSIHSTQPENGLVWHTVTDGSYFQIDTPNRVFYLWVENKEIASTWIYFLNKSIEIHSSQDPNPSNALPGEWEYRVNHTGKPFFFEPSSQSVSIEFPGPQTKKFVTS